ncbi:MAG: CAP domain-containing protein [Candidatus Magasanikbacteria bacterium]|nr:CAP domain-containing protein [Candidatus Magasanikbacteria bacterium]
MSSKLHDFFIPHHGNNYHPHILHTKRAIFYSTVFLGLKLIVFVTVLFIPARAYLAPDVLAVHYQNIIDLTNSARAQHGLPELIVQNKLNSSATAKANDMAENNYFSHFGPKAHTLQYFLSQAGYRYGVAGENLAMGFKSGEEVIGAWLKSPTHYQNLLDADYREFGLGLEAGEYSGIPTVFVAQHFGAPPLVVATASNLIVAKPAAHSTVPSATSRLALAPKVKGEKVSAPVAQNLPAIDKEHSHVFWAGDNNQTVLTIKARLTGPVAGASVIVGQYSIPLTSDPASDDWTADLRVPLSPETFFHPIIIPSIIIRAPQGQEVTDSIDWYTVKVTAPSPMEQYFNAQVLPSFKWLFSASQGIYLGFLIFFSLVLVLNIVIEFRRQHPHIIVQTVALLGLLVCLVTI